MGSGSLLVLLITAPLFNEGLIRIKRSSCKSGQYLGSRFICCQGSVHARSGKETCCSEVEYNKTESICCEGIEFKHHHPREWKCCNGAAYKDATSVCCDGKVEKKISGQTACCGNTVYDKDTDLCCNGVIQYGRAQGACCGQWAYSSRNIKGGLICCDGILLIRHSERDECCGTIAYDPHVDKCCGRDGPCKF